MSTVTDSHYLISLANLENSFNSSSVEEYILNHSDQRDQSNHCPICTCDIFMCENCMKNKNKTSKDDENNYDIENSYDEYGNYYDYNGLCCSIKQKPNESTEVWKNWEVIKDVSRTFTNTEYEYACFHNFSALRYIPQQYQTSQMIKLAFVPRYVTIDTDPHSGMSFGNSSVKEFDNYDDSYIILDCINPILLDDDICKYIFESGYWKAFCQYENNYISPNTFVQKYINLAHQKLQNILILKSKKSKSKIFEIQECKTIKELLDIYKWNSEDNIKYIPMHLLCLDTYIKMLDNYNKNEHVIQFAQSNNISETELRILKVASICINNKFDIKSLEPYKNLLTADILKYIVISHNSTTLLSNILHYLKSHNGTYDIGLSYQLIKSISTTNNINDYFKSDYWTDHGSFFDNDEAFLTPELELKLIRELLAVDADMLRHVNFSAKFSYNSRKYETYQRYTKQYVKKLNPERQQYLFKSDNFVDHYKLNGLEQTIDVYEEYDSKINASKLINSYGFINYCRKICVAPTIASFDAIEKQNQQIFLEYFEIAKHAPNFSIRNIPRGMIDEEGIRELCNKFIELDPCDLWYCNEYNGNFDIELDNLDELYKQILQLKTFHVFLLTKKYRNFDMYEISVNTYIESLKCGENKNLYFYDVDSSYNPSWYDHSSWIDFFAGHNNLTNKDLWLLSRKLVASNGLFLWHITDNIRQLPEPYKSDIISIALEQNGMALYFCTQTFDRCVQAVKSCPSTYTHVKKQFKTVELLDLAISSVLIK